MASQVSVMPGWFRVATRTLVVLARTEGACPSSAIAQHIDLHAVFVRRVLAQLVRSKLVEAREGREGGYRLARPAADITLADVYRAVKDVADTTVAYDAQYTCVDDALDAVERQVEQQMLETLGQYTVASLLDHALRARHHKAIQVNM